MKRVSVVTSIVSLGVVCSGCAVDATTPGTPPNEGETVGATGAAITVNDTPFPVSSWHGGNGGDVYTDNFCDDGYVVVGFIGNAGTTMDNLGFHCAAFYPGSTTWHYTYNTHPIGGTGGNPYSAWCPPGTWVSQVAYDYQSTVSEVFMRCSDGSTIGGWTYVGGTPSEYVVGDDCNVHGGNNAMKGVRMWSHTYVDRVLTQCVALSSP